MKSAFCLLSVIASLAVPSVSFAATPVGDTGPQEADRPTVGATEADNGGSVAVQPGEGVQIQLTDHGDGGYVWSLVSSGGLGGGTEAQVPGSGALGDFGTDVFVFTTDGLPAGDYVVRLIDKRPFGSDPGTPFTLTVTIAPHA